MPRVIAFDVNETLLDLAALDPLFARIFGDASVRRAWFGQFIHNALLQTVLGEYVPFGKVGLGALEMIAAARGITLSDADKSAIAEGVATLPPHPDSLIGLTRLKDAGFRLCALTNSTVEVATRQLTTAGLAPLLDGMFSADTVGRLKPAPEPYFHAAAQMGVPVDQVRLVAAHAWDVAGALKAGCAAAFVARPGMVVNPLLPQPDIVAPDIAAVAEAILSVGG